MKNYITSTFLEYPDNFSIATIVYFCGCGKSCNGCHNSILKEYQPLPDSISGDIDNYCKRLGTNKIVLCGGDPLFYKNLPVTNKLLSELPDYDFCIYTGFDIEEVKAVNLEKNFKFIKCGFFNQDKYIGSKKTDEFIQFATSNQQLFDKDFNLLSENGIYYFK